MSCARAWGNCRAIGQIAVYCQVGQRGYLATRILQQAGFSAANIGGGYKTYKLWQPASLPRWPGPP